MSSLSTLQDNVWTDPETLDAILDCWIDCYLDCGRSESDLIEDLEHVQSNYDPDRHNQVWSVYQKYIDILKG